jgi:CheY-like chemotaxis protein
VSYIAPEVAEEVQGDPGRLRQVLTNLAGNAIKFTEHGDVIVRLRQVEDCGESMIVCCEVTDTGIGIEDRALGKLFQPFSQADGSTTRRYGGTGLGLAISKQLVELMKGSIGVRTRPGQGSTFWFTFKVGKRGQTPAQEMPEDQLAGQKLLLVETSAARREVLAEQTRAWGMSVVEVANSEAAASALKEAAQTEEPFDCAILDANLGLQGTSDLTEAILRAPKCEQMRLVVLTPFGNRNGFVLKENEQIRHISKPVRESQLKRALTNQQKPRVAKRAAGKAQLNSAISSTQHASERGTVLIAEDNLVNQRVARHMVEKLGYRAQIVQNGLTAIEALDQGRFEVILMDCQMPEMDGFEATAVIRSREGDDGRIPIIAMTAHAMEGDRARCLQAGMDDYISKPVNPEELQRVLERWMRKPVVTAASL